MVCDNGLNQSGQCLAQGSGVPAAAAQSRAAGLSEADPIVDECVARVKAATDWYEMEAVARRVAIEHPEHWQAFSTQSGCFEDTPLDRFLDLQGLPDPRLSNVDAEQIKDVNREAQLNLAQQAWEDVGDCALSEWAPPEKNPPYGTIPSPSAYGVPPRCRKSYRHVFIFQEEKLQSILRTRSFTGKPIRWRMADGLPMESGQKVEWWGDDTPYTYPYVSPYASGFAKHKTEMHAKLEEDWRELIAWTYLDD